MSSLESFATIATEFCGWVEAKPGDPLKELESARRLASQLYAAALDLPVGSPGDAQPSRKQADARDVFKRFAVLPINMYAVVDPLTVPAIEPGVGDLADDFTDTYFDVLHGLHLYRAELHTAAAWQWSFSFRAHWGDHLVAALCALHAFATKV